jgi:hypothetical protein
MRKSISMKKSLLITIFILLTFYIPGFAKYRQVCEARDNVA